MKNKYISEQEKKKIIEHLIQKGYLTQNQIRALKKRGSI